MSHSCLEEAIRLLREAQRLVDAEHPVIAAHLESVIGLAGDRQAALADARPSGS